MQHALNALDSLKKLESDPAFQGGREGQFLSEIIRVASKTPGALAGIDPNTLSNIPNLTRSEQTRLLATIREEIMFGQLTNSDPTAVTVGDRLTLPNGVELSSRFLPPGAHVVPHENSKAIVTGFSNDGSRVKLSVNVDIHYSDGGITSFHGFPVEVSSEALAGGTATGNAELKAA
ncbi:MAG: hypothetical protein D6719_07110 [Candidatus Dadabacteria bacterium]|nr:MAG: hypothetical protein D6719_07110 [Candidatus Dadabacteria bacterium]